MRGHELGINPPQITMPRARTSPIVSDGDLAAQTVFASLPKKHLRSACFPHSICDVACEGWGLALPTHWRWSLSARHVGTILCG